MLNKNLEIELNKQQILPILNTTELRYDIKRLEVFLLNNPNIKNIEITLRQENSFEIAKELNKNFSNVNFGLGSILSEEDYLKGKEAGFHFFVSPGIVTSLVKNKVINYIPGGETISEFMYLIDSGYKIIKFFLGKYNNNVLKVADKLQVGKSTIYRMIKEGKI